jgi:hypothetical protein
MRDKIPKAIPVLELDQNSLVLPPMDILETVAPARGRPSFGTSIDPWELAPMSIGGSLLLTIVGLFLMLRLRNQR